MATITMNEIIHAAVRRDLARAEAALRAFPDGDRSRAADIKRAWDFLTDTLHHHHVGEDEYVWPFLRGLDGVDPGLGDEMESEHAEMAAALHRASAAMNELAAAATSDAATHAAESVAAAATVTSRHLEHEERSVMPVLVPQMETPEWKVVEKKLRTASGPPGPFFAWLQDGMEPEIASALAGTVPAPVRFVLSRVIGRGYQRDVGSVWR